EFQRYEVWNEKKKSRLIESILLGLPIPMFYLAEEPNKSVVVVDGQQRLMAVFRFIDNEYALSGLGPMKDELEGKYFNELSDDLQDALEEAEFSTVTILTESKPDVRFDMFERLNSGATGLNAQEIRNCEFRGPYNRYIIDLANTSDFRKILRLD